MYPDSVGWEHQGGPQNVNRNDSSNGHGLIFEVELAFPNNLNHCLVKQPWGPTQCYDRKTKCTRIQLIGKIKLNLECQ